MTTVDGSPQAEAAPGNRSRDGGLERLVVIRKLLRQAFKPLGVLGKPLKRWLPKTLFGRALLIIMTPLVLMQAISTFVFYDRHWDTMTRRLAFSMAGDIALIIEEMGTNPTEAAFAQVRGRARRHLDMQIAFRPGDRLDGAETWIPRDRVEGRAADALNERVRRPFTIDTRSIHRRIQIDLQTQIGVLEVVVHQKRLYSSTTYIFLMWMVGSSMVLFAIAIIFMRNQIRPIRRLAHASRRFGLGREVGDFKPEGASEVRQAAEAFRQMRDRIQRQISQRTEMLAGVSHDLRTPITRMKLQLAMLGDTDDIEELRADVVEMERMVEAYLAFARGEGTERPVDTDLIALAEDLAAAERRGGHPITLDLAGPDELRSEVRPHALKRALSNLLTNARRHGSEVSLTLTADRDGVDFIVDDDGPGIPEDQREQVFKPFFRLDPSRNAATGGTGLGLTIARDIARSHGGDISLGSSPGGGLRAHIRLPF